MAIGIKLSLKDAFRLSFVSFLFNLAPMGLVGGDLLKAYLLGRRNVNYRAGALASVLVDRLIGLYVMFLIAFAAVMLTGFWTHESTVARIATHASVWLAIGSTIMIFLMLMPDYGNGATIRLLGKIPLVGPAVEKVARAMEVYRGRKMTLLKSAGLTIFVHVLFSVGIFCIARGLFSVAPSVSTHLVLHPVSNVTSIIPLPAGPYETVLDSLYPTVSVVGGPDYKPGQGLIVALGYRLVTVLIAGIGGIYYLFSRDEISEAIHRIDEGELPEKTSPAHLETM
jgi:hypothetical protein